MNAEGLYAQAQAALDAGFPQTAAGFLARILRSNPRDERAWLLLASIVIERDHAIECLNRVLALNPRNTQAQSLLKEKREEASQEKVLRGKHGNLPPLGEYLLNSGVISAGQLRAALGEQRKLAASKKPKRLGEILIQQRAVSARQLQQAVREQLADFSSLFEG
jgi:tetratricopeptide (TPR) repeat protein